MYLNSGRRKYAVMSQMHCAQPTMYKFFCFKIKIKTKADSYMPCRAMAHSTKSMRCVRLVFSFTMVYSAWESFQSKQRIHSHMSMLLDFVCDTSLLTYVTGSTESTKSSSNDPGTQEIPLRWFQRKPCTRCRACMSRLISKSLQS
jgi:hypothetical protein